MKTFVKQRLWKKSLTIIIGLSFLIPSTIAEARIAFQAPAGLTVPGRRVAGASRTTLCTSKNDHLTAIVPKSNIGLTTQANPVLFFYVPPSSQSELELVVQDEKEKQKFVKQHYKQSGNGGVVAIPINKTSLEVGKQYRWSFSVICNARERSKDLFVQGGIKRISPNPQLATKLKSATLNSRVNLYAQAGIWQDALTTLAQLRSERPNDPQLKADWNELLTAEGVNLEQVSAQLVTQPLLIGNQAPQPIPEPKPI